MKHSLLLLSIFLLSFSIYAQHIDKRSLHGIENLKTTTDGDNWTITDPVVIATRTVAPCIKWSTELFARWEREFGEGFADYASVIDLSNNNLSGTLGSNFFRVDTYNGKELNVKNLHLNAGGLEFNFSHNKITGFSQTNFCRCGRGGVQVANGVRLDNNLLTSFTYKRPKGLSISSGMLFITLHQNEITELDASDFDWNGRYTSICKSQMTELRVDNNRLGFNSLIAVKHYALNLTKYYGTFAPGNPDLKFDYYPQKPLGGDATEETVAKGTSRTLSFNLTHPDNEYSWTLNGKDIPASKFNDYGVTINEASAGVYRCKITNPNMPEVTLYSYDMALFMEKAGNNTIANFNFNQVGVVENFPENMIVGTLSGTDPDGDDVYYRLPDKMADNSHFRIINGNNIISAETLFDRDYLTEYVIKVEAYDVFGGKKLKEFTITKGEGTGTPLPSELVLSSNEVNENEANATVCTLSTKPDLSEHGYAYTLPAGIADNDLFVIDGAELKVGNTALNYEAKKIYNLQLKMVATDGTEATFMIKVTAKNVNDAPHGILLSNTKMQVNNLLGAMVGILVANDEDKDDKNFTFELSPGYEDNKHFSITDNVLSLKSVITEASTLNIGVKVIDADNADFEKSFTISVVDDLNAKNEAPRMIGLTSTVILPNMQINDKVSDLVLSDPNGDLGTFNIDNEYLEVTGSVIRLKKVPTDNFTVTVEASDAEYTITQEFIFYVIGTNTAVSPSPSMKGSNIKVYPNPATTLLNIDGADNAKYEIIGLNGRVMKTSYTTPVNTSDLKPGYYLLRITTDKTTVTRRIVIK